MAGVDWGAVAAQAHGGTGSKIDWGAQSGWNLPTTVKEAPAPKQSGGGGLLGSIESGVGGFLENFGHGVESTAEAVTKIPQTLYDFNKYDARKYPVSLNPLQDWRELSQSWHDPKSLGGGFARPQVESYRRKYGPVFTHPLSGKAWEKVAGHVYKDPFGTFLDAATIASLGGGAALRGLKMADAAGALEEGGKLSQLARDERVIQSSDLSENLNRAKTVQGRLIQNRLDRYSLEHPDNPVFGVNPRLARISTARKVRAAARARVPARVFNRIAAPLTRDEKTAYHVAVEPVKLDDRIAYYEKQLAETPTRQLADYVKALKRPGVREALENPRPEFVKALWEGHGLEAKGGENLVNAGQLSAETRAERAVLPARVMSGAEYVNPATERIPGFDPYASDRAAMRLETRRAETDMRRAQARVTQLRERVRIHEGRVERAGENATPGLRSTALRARKALDDAQKTLADAKQRRDFLAEGESHVPPPTPAQTIKTEGELVGGRPAEDFIGQPNPNNPAFPPPFRWPHQGPAAGHGAGLYSGPEMSQALREKALPSYLHQNKALRLKTARLMTDPEVLSRDYLATMRAAHLNDLRDNVLRPVSKELDPALDRTGGKLPGEHYFFEKRTTRITPAMREQEALSQDLGYLDKNSRETALAKQAEGEVFTDLPKELQGKSVEELNKLGVRRVPAAFAKKYRDSFAGISPAGRIFDKYTSFYRYLTLNTRPAWGATNVVGNATQYALRYAGPEGVAAFLRSLLATERGDDKFLHLYNLTLKIPTLRRKYSRIFEDIAPEVKSAGLYGTQTRIIHSGVYEGKFGKILENRAVRVLGSMARPAAAVMKSVGRGVTYLETHIAEDVPREAAMLRELKPLVDKLKEAGLSTEQALRSLDPRDVELAVDRVNDYLGDFTSHTKLERTYIRRAIPFEAWYRVIFQVSAKLAFHYPGRIRMINLMAQSYQADNQKLPSWLHDAITIGGHKNGVQTMIATNSWNPYSTVPQLFAQNPAGALNPALGAAITAATNVDPYTMSTYHGPGANKRNTLPGFLERYLGGVAAGVAPTQFQLAQKLSGPSQSKLYAPKTYGHLGPVPINDYLLAYLGLPIKHVRIAQARRDSGL